MSQHSSPPRRDVAWLSFFIILASAPAALTSFLQAHTQNPWVTAGLIIAYEFVVALGAVISGFARKIWQQLEDSWTKLLAHRLDNQVRERFGGYERRYREYFRYEHHDLDMKGISTRGTYALDLEQVFVELRIDPTPAHQASADPLRIPAELRSGTHDVWSYLTLLDQHLVILGAPGSGKTTLLKHLGLSLIARQEVSRQQDDTQLPWTLPVFFALRELSNALDGHPEYDLAKAVEAQIQRWQQVLPSEWIERTLQKGACLVLLDGLDEIADAELRQKTVEWVHWQMVTYGKNRFVITSRPLGYQQNPLNRVAVLEVQPFTFGQVTQFLDVWYAANEIKRAMRDDPGVRMKAHEGAEDLLQRLRATPTLFALAVNPLLLTMIATVHLYYGTLPGARVTLYKAICEVFLRRRQHDPDNPHDLRAEQRQVVLQFLAYTMMQQGALELSHAEACQIIRAPLQRVGTTLTPKEFLQHLETIGSGLLLERERGMYSFAHKTFLEYLAMIHIQEQHFEQVLLTHLGENWWHETIQLYCAQADATPIIHACLAQPSLSLEALTLAIECVEEARDVQAEVRERLYGLLEQGVEDADPERRKVIVEALLTRRLRQMRSMQGIIYADTTLVTCAEYQLFLDEQRVQGNIYTPDHWHDITFPSGHSRRPILGVRATDAKSFCHWLTERDREGWIYRLPSREERQKKSKTLEGGRPEPAGYWVEEGTLIWPQGNVPQSLQEQVATLATRVRTNADARDLARVLAEALALDRALFLVTADDRAITDDLISTINRAFALVPTPADDRVHTITDVRDHAIPLVEALAHIRAIARPRDRASADALENTRTLVHALARTIENACAHAYDLAHTTADARALADTLDLIHTYTSEILLAVYLFIERMNGRFPVYEGILLMKERPTEGSEARGK